MKRTITVAMLFVLMLVMASACYAQTIGEIRTEKDKLVSDLQAYRLKAQEMIKGAEIRIIQLDAVIADREKQAAVAEKALEEAKMAEVPEVDMTLNVLEKEGIE